MATVAGFCGRELVLDEAMEERIAAILRELIGDRPGVDFDAVRAANRKQAMVPVGAEVLAPVGTAPGVVVGGSPTVVVLPGPPRELQPMWHTALATEAVQQAISARTRYRQETVRMFGLAESGLAETLARPRPRSRVSTHSRSPPACAEVNSRSSPATSPTPPGPIGTC